MGIAHALAIGLLLAGCAAQSAPRAAVLPTAIPTTGAPVAPALRYAIDPALRAFGLDFSEQAQSGVLVDTYDSEGEGFDLVLVLGEREDMNRVPQPLQIVLWVNSALPPLDAPERAALARTLFSADALAQWLPVAGARLLAPPATASVPLRETLANSGFLDGWQLRLAHTPLPDLAPLLNASAARGVKLVPYALTLAQREVAAHLLLTAWVVPPYWADEAIVLAELPLSYKVAALERLTWGANGLPLVRNVP